jgi:hypothetical protein
MSSLQVYSNSTNLYSSALYVCAFTIGITIGLKICLYCDEYIRNINEKMDTIRKMVETQTDIIKNNNNRILQLEEEIQSYSNSIKQNSQWVSGISKEINGIENNIQEINENMSIFTEKVKENINEIFDRLNNLDEKCVENSKTIEDIDGMVTNVDSFAMEVAKSSDINMDKIFKMENTINNLEDACTNAIKTIVEATPDYVLIGYVGAIPLFVPNDFTFTEENIIKYLLFGSNFTLVTSHFRFLKNVKEIKLDNFKVSESSFTFANIIHFMLENSKNKEKIQENTILNMSHQGLQAGTVNYIPNIQGTNTRTYFKKGLLTLRSELLKMDIKLILNKDFEEFIR